MKNNPKDDRSDLLYLRVGIDEKLKNSSFHPAFSLFMPATKELIALLALLKERHNHLLFRSQKTSELHEWPKSKFPTLENREVLSV